MIDLVKYQALPVVDSTARKKQVCAEVSSQFGEPHPIEAECTNLLMSCKLPVVLLHLSLVFGPLLLVFPSLLFFDRRIYSRRRSLIRDRLLRLLLMRMLMLGRIMRGCRRSCRGESTIRFGSVRRRLLGVRVSVITVRLRLRVSICVYNAESVITQQATDLNGNSRGGTA